MALHPHARSLIQAVLVICWLGAFVLTSVPGFGADPPTGENLYQIRCNRSNVMDSDYRRMVDFLVGLGTESVPHTGEKGFLAHLIGVYRDLESWGCDRDVCRAGLFHSIYGTELFQKFSLPLQRRDEVRQLIGERAERLAFVNCVMDRSSFDRLIPGQGPYPIADRLSGEMIELDQQDFHDLCVVHLCDWLEQVPRSQQWDYRQTAYRGLAERLGGIAKQSFDRVYSAALI